MQAQHDVTQAEIDAAIVDCLRIFAARGRALRQQREKLANASEFQKSRPAISDSQEQESDKKNTAMQQPMEESVQDAYG